MTEFHSRQDISFSPADFYGAVYGLKPVSRIGIDSKMNLDLLREKCREFGLELKKVKSKIYGSKEENQYCYIGEDIKQLNAAIEAERKDKRLEVGKLLGYPRCCTRTFVQRMSKKKSSIEDTYRQEESMNYLLNSLYNLSGRGQISPSQNEIDSLLDSDFFNRLGRKSYHYLPHHPCSADCEASMQLGTKLRDIFDKEIPEFKRKLETVLKKPVLLINDLEFFAFEGEFRNGGLDYEQINPQLSRTTDPELMEMLQECNRLRQEEERVKILKDGKKMHELKSNLLEFTD